MDNLVINFEPQLEMHDGRLGDEDSVQPMNDHDYGQGAFLKVESILN